MTLDYEELLRMESLGNEVRYSDREVILYALGIGLGRDPLNNKELKFVYENDLQTVPTMATVLAMGLPTLARAPINWVMLVHGEQRLTIHKPLPPFDAEVIADERCVGAVDKGENKGALIFLEKTIREKTSGEKLCTLGATLFARGNGGFSGPKDGGPGPHPIPSRAPDLVVECDTRPDQAFLYALSGDRNPLHRDPMIAKMAGFERPILQGLCTYGTACRAILQGVVDYDAKKIVGFDVRFSAPLYPGETVVSEIWVDGPVVSFQCRAKEREIAVLKNGKCTLAA
jgi:acyl dehydratase